MHQYNAKIIVVLISSIVNLLIILSANSSIICSISSSFHNTNMIGLMESLFNFYLLSGA